MAQLIRKWAKYFASLCRKHLFWYLDTVHRVEKAADLVHFFNEDGLGAIVNSSRGIIAAYKQEAYAEFGELNYADASRKAVEVMIEDISGALKNR